MRALVLLALWPGVGLAESVVATRTIRPETVIGPADVTAVDAVIPGAATKVGAVVGQEARVAIYAGRPVRPEDLGAPATVDRNQLVPISYRTGALVIAAEGRALSRGGVGDVIRVMNLGSRATVSGRVGADGQIHVATAP